jgi:Glycosyl transferase family 2
MRFFAVTTLRNGPVDLLSHWLTHQLRLGVGQIVLCVFQEEMRERLDEIKSASAGLPVRIELFSDWTDDRQEQIMREALDRAGCQKRDWVVHADLDEFNEFPCPLEELASAMERADRAAVHGHFIDRVHAQGLLIAAPPAPTIWEQFPIECRLTEKILRGFTQKIMLARHEVIVTNGHHEASVPSGNPVIGRESDYRVHHFKWRAGVVGRF